MKKYIIIISLSIIAFSSSVFSNDKYLSNKTWYKLYQERVTNVCSEYKFDNKDTQTIYLMDESNKYLNLDESSISNSIRKWKDIELAKEQYKTNMDAIYNCAVKQSQYRWYNLMIDVITKRWELKDYKNLIKSKQNIILEDLAVEGNKCKINPEKKDSIIKASVLKQTSYELCRYNYYLEYLKEVNDDISKLDEKTKKDPNNALAIKNIIDIRSKKINEIEREIDDAYNKFPIAFKAYSEYENYVTYHNLLQLIRQDYLTFREKLHKNLNPINQVVYKISNAMKK